MTTAANIGEGNTADREIVLSRVFDAPRELVWEAMANAEQVMNWWGPRGFTTTIEVMDLKPGGAWKHVMHGPDGTDYPNHSIFTEVVKPERMVYVHRGGRAGAPEVNKVTAWTFEAIEGGKTRLTLRHIFETKEERDVTEREYGAVEGATQTFARLGEFLAPDSVILDRLLDAPIDLVWRALTDLEQMKKWYFPMLKAFQAEVGFETQVDVEHEGKVYEHLWKVTEVVPGQKIAYGWRYVGSPGHSIVSWELFPEGHRTRLRLMHTGLESFEPAKNPQYARSNFFGGWTHFAGTLAKFVEERSKKS